MSLISVQRYCPPTGGVVASFIQTQVLRLLCAWNGTLSHDRFRSLLQQFGIVDIRRVHHNAQWPTPCFHEDAALGSRLASVGRIPSDRIPPIRALPIAASADCHSRSTPPNSSQWDWITAQTLGNTPADSHLWNVRWMVLSSPRHFGSLFHWQPERIRKMIAFSILRGSCLLRPVAFGGSSSPSTTSISSQRSSGVSQIVSSVSCLDILRVPPQLSSAYSLPEVLTLRS